ncbi:MAG: response regulator [Desulfomonile tiedjei]|nr:response regulator [Desulfomonile tiedjei]
MTDKRSPTFSADEELDSHRLFQLRSEATQSLDLGGLFTKDVTASGSFDIRGGIWASTFGKLLQSLPIPAFLVDQNSTVMAANQACARMNPDYERLPDQAFANLFPNASEAGKAISLLEEVMQTRKPKTTESVLGFGKGKVWARLTFRSIRMMEARLVLVLVEDLTNEKKLLRLSQKYQEELEKRVERRTAELTEVNVRLRKEMKERKRAENMLIQSERLRAVGEMSAGVAHNMKNLIQMLFGLTHAAMNHLDDDNVLAARAELDNIVQSLQLGTETVRRLQDFARMGTEQSSQHGTIVDLSRLTRQAIDFARPFWQTYPQSRGTRVNLNTALAEGCLVKGNQGQLFEVLVNLIKNAAESLAEGGEIDLTTSVENGEVTLAVRDTGAGIPQEDMVRLFEPFFTTKGEVGTGLGLATSRSIVGNHGGTISVQSTVGQGTTFTVKLPLTEQEPKRAEASAVQTIQRKLNILAVDDMESTLAMLRLGLEAYQHTVLTAHSGEEALEIFRTHAVDLVLCDFAMPGMNGCEVGRRIGDLCKEKLAPCPPFILLTAWGRQSIDRTKLTEAGVAEVLEKPVDIRQLMGTLEEILRQSDAERNSGA